MCDDDDLQIANCSIKSLSFTFWAILGNFGQAMLIRSCHEDVIFARKRHNCSGTAFVQGGSAGSSKLIEYTLWSISFSPHTSVYAIRDIKNSVT